MLPIIQACQHLLKFVSASRGGRPSPGKVRNMSLSDLSRIFKAYDVRGVYPDDINETVAERLGAAFAAFVKAPKVIVGRDMRLSSPALAAAFTQGATRQGAGVIDVGDVRDRSDTVAGQDPVGAVRAELRTAAAGEQRKTAADWPR